MQVPGRGEGLGWEGAVEMGRGERASRAELTGCQKGDRGKCRGFSRGQLSAVC